MQRIFIFQNNFIIVHHNGIKIFNNTTGEILHEFNIENYNMEIYEISEQNLF